MGGGIVDFRRKCQIHSLRTSQGGDFQPLEALPRKENTYPAWLNGITFRALYSWSD